MEVRQESQTSRKRGHRAFIIAAAILVAAAAVSVYFGAAKVGFLSALTDMDKRILGLRAGRILLALTVGGGLSVAGVILQGLMRNPLCEPYVLGISSGAALGAVISTILLGMQHFLGLSALPVWAFMGAVAAFFIVYRISEVNGRIPVQNLLLTGVIVGAVFSSVVIFLVSFSEKEYLHSVIWWLLGNLQIFDMNLLLSVMIIVITAVILAALNSRELNAISLGEEEAAHLGVDIEKTKKRLFIIASVITGAAVSAAGMIGFVGLIVPHFVRLVIGANHRAVIPVSFVAGGAFLIFCDLIARMVMLPAEVPVGVITALCGGPFFLYLLRKRSRAR
ncbi:MAG: iron ABC transporter permease [Candidatus Omnitrophica bacterium]|nr:iron ABC transporter permease [Candidatus Omnitrophota bacterium]